MIDVTACPACGAGLRPAYEAETPAGPMKVSTCDGCGSLVKAPFYDPAELGEIYRRYALHEARYDLPPGEVEALTAKLRRIERSAGTKGRLLEIGCGRGHLLSIARSRGWDARGVELGGGPEDHLLPEIKDRVALVGSERDYASLETASVDVLCSYQVFEHLLDPAGSFREWARALKPGGLMVLDTPNAESLGARRHQGRWIQNARPEHFVIFSRRALERLFHAQGIRVMHRHAGGPPAFCSGRAGSGAQAGPSPRAIFRSRWLSRLARSVVQGLGLGDNIELHGRKAGPLKSSSSRPGS